MTTHIFSAIHSFNKFIYDFASLTSLPSLFATTACYTAWEKKKGENMPSRKFNLAWFSSLKKKIADWSERKGEFFASFPSLKTQSEMILLPSPCRHITLITSHTDKIRRRWNIKRETSFYASEFLARLFFSSFWVTILHKEFFNFSFQRLWGSMKRSHTHFRALKIAVYFQNSTDRNGTWLAGAY